MFFFITLHKEFYWPHWATLLLLFMFQNYQIIKLWLVIGCPFSNTFTIKTASLANLFEREKNEETKKN